MVSSPQKSRDQVLDPVRVFFLLARACFGAGPIGPQENHLLQEVRRELGLRSSQAKNLALLAQRDPPESAANGIQLGLVYAQCYSFASRNGGPTSEEVLLLDQFRVLLRLEADVVRRIEEAVRKRKGPQVGHGDEHQGAMDSLERQTQAFRQITGAFHSLSPGESSTYLSGSSTSEAVEDSSRSKFQANAVAVPLPEPQSGRRSSADLEKSHVNFAELGPEEDFQISVSSRAPPSWESLRNGSEDTAAMPRQRVEREAPPGAPEPPSELAAAAPWASMGKTSRLLGLGLFGLVGLGFLGLPSSGGSSSGSTPGPSVNSGAGARFQEALKLARKALEAENFEVARVRLDNAYDQSEGISSSLERNLAEAEVAMLRGALRARAKKVAWELSSAARDRAVSAVRRDLDLSLRLLERLEPSTRVEALRAEVRSVYKQFLKQIGEDAEALSFE